MPSAMSTRSPRPTSTWRMGATCRPRRSSRKRCAPRPSAWPSAPSCSRSMPSGATSRVSSCWPRSCTTSRAARARSGPRRRPWAWASTPTTSCTSRAGSPAKCLGLPGSRWTRWAHRRCRTAAPAGRPAFQPAPDATLDGGKEVDLDLDLPHTPAAAPAASAQDTTTTSFQATVPPGSAGAVDMELVDDDAKTIPVMRTAAVAPAAAVAPPAASAPPDSASMGLDFDLGDFDLPVDTMPPVGTAPGSSPADTLDFGDFSLDVATKPESEAAPAPADRATATRWRASSSWPRSSARSATSKAHATCSRKWWPRPTAPCAPRRRACSTRLAELPRLALGLSYRGQAYHGWQSQPDGRTVQDALERALTAFAAEPVSTVCAGRTDSGVHALNQVVHIDTGLDRDAFSWVRGSNRYLPRDIAVQWCRPVGADFHARNSARGRRYRYRGAGVAHAAGARAGAGGLGLPPARCRRHAGRCGAPDRRARLQLLPRRRAASRRPR